MAGRKSLEESEQTAKVWQVDATNQRFDALEKQVSSGFNAINNRLETLVLKSESQVTPQQLESNIAAVKASNDQAIKDSEEKLGYRIIGLEDKVKSNNRKTVSMTGVVITVGTAVVIAAFMIILNGGNG